MNDITTNKSFDEKNKDQIEKSISLEIDLNDYGIDKKIPIVLNITINISKNQNYSYNQNQETKEDQHMFLTLLG